MKHTIMNIISNPIVTLILALTMTGCGSITRDLDQVDPTTAALQIKVKTALIKAADIDAASIAVEYSKESILLTGFVDDEAESNRAEQLSRETADNMKVVNQLKIR